MAAMLQHGPRRRKRPVQMPRQTTQRPREFHTISEAAAELDVKPHVLRFWESKFKQVGPLKHGGSRRCYRREDINLLRRIRSLLYRDGYSIKGVQRLLDGEGRPGPGPEKERPVDLRPIEIEARGRSSRRKAVAGLPLPPMPSVNSNEPPDIRSTLMDLRRALVELRQMLLMS